MSTPQNSLKSLVPIDWQALTLLGHEINSIQGNPYSRNDLAVLAAPEQPKEFVLMVMSIIASSQNPRFSPQLPTEDDLKRLKPFIGSVQRLIEKVSPTWASRFGRYIERVGQYEVSKAAQFITASIEWCRGFESPRQQFIQQLAQLYCLIFEQVETEGFLTSRPATIEEKIEGMFNALRCGRSNMLPGFNAETFPLLFGAARKLGFPRHDFPASQAAIAGAELMDGIYRFLYAQGFYDIPPPPPASEFDLFDSSTWMRGIAEAFCPEKLALVQEHFPEILYLIARILPESGPELADAIYRIAEQMCELRESGMTPEEISRLLFC